ncbi:hypothetical protein QOT17_010086 [Balamuthia mandrillaris]
MKRRWSFFPSFAVWVLLLHLATLDSGCVALRPLRAWREAAQANIATHFVLPELDVTHGTTAATAARREALLLDPPLPLYDLYVVMPQEDWELLWRAHDTALFKECQLLFFPSNISQTEEVKDEGEVKGFQLGGKIAVNGFSSLRYRKKSFQLLLSANDQNFITAALLHNEKEEAVLHRNMKENKTEEERTSPVLSIDFFGGKQVARLKQTPGEERDGEGKEMQAKNRKGQTLPSAKAKKTAYLFHQNSIDTAKETAILQMHQKKMILRSEYLDGTFLRNKLVNDLIRAAGGYAPRTRFFRLFFVASSSSASYQLLSSLSHSSPPSAISSSSSTLDTKYVGLYVANEFIDENMMMAHSLQDRPLWRELRNNEADIDAFSGKLKGKAYFGRSCGHREACKELRTLLKSIPSSKEELKKEYRDEEAEDEDEERNGSFGYRFIRKHLEGKMLDLRSFFAFHIVNMWALNLDHQNNFFFYRAVSSSSIPFSPFVVVNLDGDTSFGKFGVPTRVDVEVREICRPLLQPRWMFRRLLEVPEYKEYCKQETLRLLVDGPLNSRSIRHRILSHSKHLRAAIMEDHQKWFGKTMFDEEVEYLLNVADTRSSLRPYDYHPSSSTSLVTPIFRSTLSFLFALLWIQQRNNQNKEHNRKLRTSTNVGLRERKTKEEDEDEEELEEGRRKRRRKDDMSLPVAACLPRSSTRSSLCALFKKNLGWKVGMEVLIFLALDVSLYRMMDRLDTVEDGEMSYNRVVIYLGPSWALSCYTMLWLVLRIWAFVSIVLGENHSNNDLLPKLRQPKKELDDIFYFPPSSTSGSSLSSPTSSSSSWRRRWKTATTTFLNIGSSSRVNTPSSSHRTHSPSASNFNRLHPPFLFLFLRSFELLVVCSMLIVIELFGDTTSLVLFLPTLGLTLSRWIVSCLRHYRRSSLLFFFLVFFGGIALLLWIAAVLFEHVSETVYVDPAWSEMQQLEEKDGSFLQRWTGVMFF